MSISIRSLIWISIMFLLVSFATRVGLAVICGDSFALLQWARFMLMGSIFDLAVLPYMLLPWALYYLIVPTRHFPRFNKVWSFVWAVAYMSFVVIVAASEFVFWNEFSTRFDFIAVDYLIYTHEVIGNIQESYPVYWWTSALVIFCSIVVWKTWPKETQHKQGRFLSKLYVAVGTACAVCVSFLIVDQNWTTAPNTYVQQLSNNGLFAFTHAYRHNQLNYNKYYPTLDQVKLNKKIRSLVKQNNTNFTSPKGIERQVTAHTAPKKLNVVLITVESLSAEFMAHFGNKQNLTPELDKLADQSLFFSNLYATGTRTVRGLEALTVGTPPTPGQSIVRRPNNEHLENLGEELGQNGWKPYWIYGGYGLFDNMNAYFGNNGYEVVDRTDAEKEQIQIHAENIWGIADEDLFTLAISKIDQHDFKKERFFTHIMTTSNHRPYTFPENRVDLPQKKREGAVKYTDWALGDFIHRASKKPWFDDTLFIILADHTSKAAGKTDLPLWRYHIPMIWYAPKWIKPQKMDRLMSQIDVGPTLLEWLGVSYTGRFFGYDIFNLEKGRERAFISTYQKLGYIKKNRLVVFDVNKPVKIVDANDEKVIQTPTDEDKQLIDEAIAWYQSASQYFLEGKLTESYEEKD